MPRLCSQCGTELPNDSPHCARCGERQDDPLSHSPLPESGRAQSSPAEGDKRFPLWQVLPWTLLAAALLLLLPPLLRQQPPKRTVSVQPAAAALSVPVQPAALPRNSPAPRIPAHKPALSRAAVSPSAAPVPVSAAPLPLTVTLYSASKGRHIAVGTPVTISVYAALPPGQSATLAVSYGKDGGPKSLLSLAQGSLSSTTWTPLLPGRYLFTASALDSRKNGVFSHPVSIFVDAPAPIPVPKPSAPARVAAKSQAAKPSAPKPAALKPVALKRRSTPAPAAYHVAAAVFPIRRIAATLASALKGRGFNAFVRPGTDGNGKPVYRVETGDFTRQTDADAQMRLLKKDGYPAFLFHTH